MAYYASKLIKIALAEEGYIEKKSNKQLDSKKANAGNNNYTKYNRDMKKVRGAGTLTDYWCANFVSWCFYKAFGKKQGNKLMKGYTNYVPYIYNHFKKHYKKAKKGDIVIYKNQCHTGIVYKVKGNLIYTIEGNTSATGFNANGGAVAKKVYNMSSSWVECFVRPDYTIPLSEYPTLKKGSKNAYVKKLKSKLKSKGYKGMDNNDKFGDGTLKAVKSFQKKKKLKVDGIVGSKTWKALYK